MILVDTSVWIDHLHRAEPGLQRLLADDLVVVSDGIIEELALGSIRRRTEVLALMAALHRAPSLRHDELLAFVAGSQLWGRGLSAIDVQLLGSARLERLTIWSRDQRLLAAAEELDIDIVHEQPEDQ